MGFERQQLEAILTETLGIPLAQRFYVHLFETLPSTNQMLWQLLEQGAGAGTIV